MLGRYEVRYSQFLRHLYKRLAMSLRWKFFLLGFVAVFALKYLVFGLSKWDSIFHPERLNVESGEGLI